VLVNPYLTESSVEHSTKSINSVPHKALLSLLVSRDLFDLVTEQADDELVFPTERWAATFRSHSQLILHELGDYLGYSPPPLLDRLIEDAQKIHVSPVCSHFCSYTI
jgi:hypothetical protein